MEVGVQVWIRERNGPWLESTIADKIRVDKDKYKVVVQYKAKSIEYMYAISPAL
jgi:hypothetical protein